MDYTKDSNIFTVHMYDLEPPKYILELLEEKKTLQDLHDKLEAKSSKFPWYVGTILGWEKRITKYSCRIIRINEIHIEYLTMSIAVGNANTVTMKKFLALIDLIQKQQARINDLMEWL